MDILENLKIELSGKLNKILGADLVQSADFTLPFEKKLGDLALPCFALSKKVGSGPAALAQKLADELKPAGEVVALAAAGPYLNFTLDKAVLADKLLPMVDANYGQSQQGQGKKVMLEYSNVNTHKAYHIGHLRNLVYGDAINRLLLTCGYDALPVTYVNDFGVHVAKTLWWLYQPRSGWQERLAEIKSSAAKGFCLGEIYQQAVGQLTDQPENNQAIADIMQAIESRSGEWWQRWQTSRQWSLDYFSQNIYKALGVKFERSYYESDYVEAGKVRARQLLEQGILQQSQGAIIADLTDQNLGVLVVVRSDGTALYPVADLALAEAKAAEKPWRSLVIVDKRQNLYFKQLFALLKSLGHTEQLAHLAYDFVQLPEGLISSRAGTILSFDQAYNQVAAAALQATQERHADWPLAKLQATAAILTIAVLKFELLKIAADKIITFDLEAALRFDGYTAIYLQYAVARINSILRLSSDLSSVTLAKERLLTETLEGDLVWLIAQFPQMVQRAAENYQPSLVAQYLFDLAKNFNDYYHQVPILKAEAAVSLARLNLIKAVRQVLQNGLELLGIAAVEEM